MPTLSPVTAALWIVLVVAFVGSIVAYLRDRARFYGYERLTKDVLRLARSVKGEAFRDGADLAVTGAWHEFPVQIRFSDAENTPGLHIRMGAPAAFSLSIMPARLPQASGGFRVRTSDEMFNARFALRSSDPTQALMFLGQREVMNAVQKLCRSSQAFLAISTGLIEFGQLGAPDQQSAREATAHLDALARLAAELNEMPGAHAIKVERWKRRLGVALRVALAIGVLASVVGLIVEARTGNTPQQTASTVPAGVAPADADRIAGVKNWSLAKPEDLDAAALGWARARHHATQSRIEGDFCADSRRNDVAYLLVGPDNTRRLVVLCGTDVVYDSKFPYIGIAVRLPKDVVRSIQWSVKPSEEPEGDSLLITRAPDDPASGLVLFTRKRRVVTGVPINYQTVNLD